MRTKNKNFISCSLKWNQEGLETLRFSYRARLIKMKKTITILVFFHKIHQKNICHLWASKVFKTHHHQSLTSVIWHQWHNWWQTWFTLIQKTFTNRWNKQRNFILPANEKRKKNWKYQLGWNRPCEIIQTTTTHSLWFTKNHTTKFQKETSFKIWMIRYS